MLNYEDLDTCDTSAFRKDAAKWQGLAGALANHGNDLQAAVTGLDSWIGDAADAAKAEFGTHRQQFTKMAETIGKIPPVLTSLAGRIDQLREQLEQIVTAHSPSVVRYTPMAPSPTIRPSASTRRSRQVNRTWARTSHSPARTTSQTC
jgi:uncharacterized protein YukE